MHSFDDQRLRYCDNGVAFLVNTADQSCKFSRARVVKHQKSALEMAWALSFCKNYNNSGHTSVPRHDSDGFRLEITQGKR